MQPTSFILPDEECYWIRERSETDGVFNIPIWVQYVCVRRGGDVLVHQNVIGICESLGLRGAPPIMLLTPNPVSVANALATTESIRNQKRTDLPPIIMQVGGETFVEVEHPALEVIPDAPNR